jgi:hypothetical protein
MIFNGRKTHHQIVCISNEEITTGIRHNISIIVETTCKPLPIFNIFFRCSMKSYPQRKMQINKIINLYAFNSVVYDFNHLKFYWMACILNAADLLL